MIDREKYAEHFRDAPYLDLIKRRDHLVAFMREFEEKEMAGDRSDPDWMGCPSPDVRYQVYFDYLMDLCEIMRDRYNCDYVGSRRALQDDAEGR